MRLVTLILLLLSLNLNADVFDYPIDLNNITFKNTLSILQQDAINRSQFIHRKKIAILKRPLISSGYFIFSQQKGLYWKVEKPLLSAFLMTEKKLIEIIYRQGKIREKKSHLQMGQHFGRIFLSLFNGNLAQLQDYFILYFQQQDKQWVLGLIPKEPLLKKVIKSIQLTGNRQIESLLIKEQSGDRSDYQFNFQSRLPLTTNELLLFK
jgi:hypothetical protein